MPVFRVTRNLDQAGQGAEFEELAVIAASAAAARAVVRATYPEIPATVANAMTATDLSQVATPAAWVAAFPGQLALRVTIRKGTTNINVAIPFVPTTADTADLVGALMVAAIDPLISGTAVTYTTATNTITIAADSALGDANITAAYEFNGVALPNFTAGFTIAAEGAAATIRTIVIPDIVVTGDALPIVVSKGLNF